MLSLSTPTSPRSPVLDEDFALDLITQPVAAYYTFTPATLKHIYHRTVGQPYYTQLLGHNLFTSWTRERLAQLDIVLQKSFCRD